MRVYIAGPLTPRGARTDAPNKAIEYCLNVRDMARAAHRLIKMGHAPYCPGTDILIFVAGIGEPISEEEIKKQSLDWLDASDAILMLPGWETSAGAKAEHSRALELGMPIYENTEDMPHA